MITIIIIQRVNLTVQLCVYGAKIHHHGHAKLFMCRNMFALAHTPLLTVVQR